MAPEAAMNYLEDSDLSLTPAVDTYSLGVTMYRVLMKESPNRVAAKMPNVSIFSGFACFVLF